MGLWLTSWIPIAARKEKKGPPEFQESIPGDIVDGPSDLGNSCIILRGPTTRYYPLNDFSISGTAADRKRESVWKVQHTNTRLWIKINGGGHCGKQLWKFWGSKLERFMRSNLCTRCRVWRTCRNRNGKNKFTVVYVLVPPKECRCTYTCFSS